MAWWSSVCWILTEVSFSAIRVSSKVREKLPSNTSLMRPYTRGYAQRGGLVNPAKLTLGLAKWLQDQGVEIHERTPATSVQALAEGCEVTTPRRRLEAGRGRADEWPTPTATAATDWRSRT